MRQNLAEKALNCTVSKVSYLFVTRTYKIQFVLIKIREDVFELLAPIIHLKYRKYQDVSALVCDRYILVANNLMDALLTVARTPL